MIPTDDADIDHDQHSELATDIVRSIESFADDLENSGDTADGAEMAAMGMPPIGLEQVMGMLAPAIASKADADPARAKRSLALIHLETGALLEYHADDEPEALLE